MDDETKKKINRRYKRELNKGERFWPDSIFKDAIVSLGVFILLILLATFIGVGAEPKADPSDTTFIPRPEWYFLFLFKFLAIYGQIPLLGKIEWIATVAVPGVAVLALALLPFIDRSPYRYYGKRVLPISIMAIMVVDIVMLTVMADVPTVTATGAALPGILQAFAGLVIPGVAMILLFLMTFVFRKTSTETMIWTTAISVVLTIALAGTVLAFFPPAPVAATDVATTLVDQITYGQDYYSLNCTECHGEDGKATVIEGVKGLDGKEIPAINSTDVLYTFDDATLAETIAHGRPVAGMTPFGKAYGGALSTSEIGYIVTFMRYSWDDRFQLPPEALKPLYPPLAENEVPSYDVHIAPIVKRYCLGCHQAGKQNNNYVMDTYENILNTGDQKPNVVAGDPDSTLLKVVEGTPIPDPKDPTQQLIRAMPPNHQLNANIVNVFKLWVLAGMPRTADDAAKSTPPAPVATPTAEPEGPAHPSNPGGPGDAINLQGDAVAGAQVFTAQCEKCHGPNGTQGVDNPGSVDGSVPPLNPIDSTMADPDYKTFATNIDLFVQHGSTPEGTNPKIEMPAFGDQNKLPQQQIADVIAYVISLNPSGSGTAVPEATATTTTGGEEVARPSNAGGPGEAINTTGDPVLGAQLFTSQCAKCHGPNGAQGVDNPGSTDGSVPVLNPIDPTLVNADYKTFATNLDLFLQHGSTPDGPNPKLEMPAFGDKNLLDQNQIADIIAYVISLNPSGSGTAIPEATATTATGGDEVARPSNSGGSGDAVNLAGDATAGAQVFASQCEKCHGPEGTQGVDNPGSTDGSVPVLNPIDPTLKSPDPKTFTFNLDLFLQNGSTPEGSNPKLGMPAFGAKNLLTQQQIADVIAYVIKLNP
jgi:mono/diheme cytochrome c family protein